MGREGKPVKYVEAVIYDGDGGIFKAAIGTAVELLKLQEMQGRFGTATLEFRMKRVKQGDKFGEVLKAELLSFVPSK